VLILTDLVLRIYVDSRGKLESVRDGEGDCAGDQDACDPEWVAGGEGAGCGGGVFGGEDSGVVRLRGGIEGEGSTREGEGDGLNLRAGR
jgi:hypothetical protein